MCPDVATYLPPSGTPGASHGGPTEQEGAETPLCRRGLQGALAGKRAADSRARALVQIIQELRAVGVISRRALADELNRRKIPTARGRRWHYTSVVRMLSRLGLLASLGDARINNGQSGKQSADAKAKALAPTVRELQASFDTLGTVARELNALEIAAPRDGKWHATSVRRLLQRIDKLDRAAPIKLLRSSQA